MTPSHDDALPATEQAQLGVHIWHNAFCAALLDMDAAQRKALLARLERLGQTIEQGKDTPSRVNTHAARNHALHLVRQAVREAENTIPPLRVPQWCRDVSDCD
ncbi:hypothetical protein MSKU15_0246 [Komagataeibacter diospyri]|uniref:hypothetical protein n=1 Tax=Komagataeibacter diospyri TaxID=1932662 RepID=UPI001139624F|nr:hypothetical protein [Komagataeibacter diospyri]GCE88645.1 hypothetical protein MSKU15_0246 [Komagataeibacter diospyri]